MQERSRSPDVALSRAPEYAGPAAGRRVVPDALARMKAAQVRCPHCQKLLAEQLHGMLTVTCTRCKRRLTIER
jgi:hypothetical protein